MLAKIFNKPVNSEVVSLDSSLENKSVFIKKKKVVREILGLPLKSFEYTLEKRIIKSEREIGSEINCKSGRP